MFRVIETFSGIGSQAKALTRIGKPFEIVNTADWDINAILAYCLIHKGKIDINKYAEISDEDVTNFLKGLSLSSDGKKPMSDYQKSVFRGDMTPSRFISLRAELKKVINEDEDFICIVKLKNDSVFGEEVLGNGGEPTGEDLII